MSDKKVKKSQGPVVAEVIDAPSKKEETSKKSASKEDVVIDITTPVVGKETLPKSSSTDLAPLDPLKQYLREISRHKLLTPEEESELVWALYETGDINIAKKLVVANLRLVVKIAMEYRSAHQNVMDLIQEGNVGLMKAVSKYNPEKGAKLSYYASWWIKSYILKFILDNFRLIKIGTTADQKKLFYNLIREKERLLSQGLEPDVKLLSEKLDVPEKAVQEMDFRLSSQGQAISLDTPVSRDGNLSLGDSIGSKEEGIDDQISHLESLEILEERLGDFLKDLNDRDKDIFKKRLLTELPPSLQSIANDYGVSRERIRQIEERLLKKLKVYMSEYLS